MELPTWLWLLIAVVLGIAFGSLSWGLKKKTAANMAKLDEMKAKAARGDDGIAYRDDYRTTEAVMNHAILEDDFPVDSMEN